MRTSIKLFSALLGVLAFVACTAQSGQTGAPGPSVEQQAATIVAATMSAATAQAAQAAPVTTPIGQMPTSGAAPMLFINVDNAACRDGPGPDFKVIANFPAGTSVSLVGQDSADSYWIVKDPGSNSNCWVSVMDATPTGDYQSLPQMTPQAASAGVPGKPTRGTWYFNCDNTTLTISLGWNAPSGSVNGYRIYRKGTQVADVPANQTTYSEKIPFVYGSSIEYAVAAYNEAGVSQQTSWNIHCP